MGATSAVSILSLALFSCIPGEDKGDAGAGDACGSRGLPPCAEDSFCSFPESAACGEGDAPGICEERPTACTREYAPVCGCDGKTYGNRCTAAAAGVSARYQGECTTADAGFIDAGLPDAGFTDAGSASCGGLTGAPCEVNQFCDYALDAQCGAADQTGVCRDIPEVCPLHLDPVCGCDDETYGNACEAARAGVSVRAEGACEAGDAGVGGTCGGFAGIACPADLYCKFTIEAHCGAGDQAGTCEKRPDVCTLEYDPVCGCDAKTYGNACAAAGAGVSIVYEGKCRER